MNKVLVGLGLLTLLLGSISAGILAYFHPEYLTSLAYGLGAIGVVVLCLLLTSGKRVPNPVKG